MQTTTRSDEYSDIPNVPPSEVRPTMGEIIRELASGTRNLMRSEIALAKAETKETMRQLGRQTAMVIGFGVLALLSILPFLAFVVIGLGDLLGHRYWLSSLLVSVAMAAIGGIVAYRAFKQIKQQDFSLPAFRDSLKDEKNTYSHGLEEVTSQTRRAA